MYLFSPEDPRPVHFLGIAGAGMSALALVARRRGVTVTGCDIDVTQTSDLVAAGIEVFNGHDPSHVAKARAVVYTSAAPQDHVELVEAKRTGVPIIRRAEALAQLVSHGTVVAIAGTHGKTTTTAMTTEALIATGMDPTGIVGGRIAEWGGNARLGSDQLFVVEADEYDKSFLALEPDIAVINNVEPEHLECYGSEDALYDAFVEFGNRASRVIVGSDGEGASRVADRLRSPVWRVGRTQDADIRIENASFSPERTKVRLSGPAESGVEFSLTVPGMHNVENAAAAMGAVWALNADVDLAAGALANFQGVGRRFEIIGTFGGVTIVDDYAHHATEVKATLEAARLRFPSRRIVIAFQPHLFSRTERDAQALGSALTLADRIFITDVYPAREQPIPGVTGRLVLDAAISAGAESAKWVVKRSDLAEVIAGEIEDGDVVFTVGAGDITQTARELAEVLQRTNR